MGYILKTAAAGAGTATKANQNIQIDQLTDTSGQPSVFKDTTSDLSVFLSGLGESVFCEPGTLTPSLPKITNSSAQIQTYITKSVNVGSGTLCVSFTAATPAALQILVQAFLAVPAAKIIVNMSYTDAGAGNHHCYITYNT
jgi:hypothetical protein